MNLTASAFADPQDCFRAMLRNDQTARIFPATKDALRRGLMVEICPRGAALDDFSEALGEGISESEEWDWRGWIDHAKGAGDIVLSVRESGSSRPLGFASIAPDLHLSGTWEGKPTTIFFGVDLVCVYVVPAMRGEGLGSALRKAVSDYVTSVLESIADQSTGDVVATPIHCLEVLVTGHVFSDEGGHFARVVADEVRGKIEALRESKTWIEDISYSEEIELSSTMGGGPLP